ncbi:hypothetical protein GQ600_1474 [Phytophthora cactorum]|nr:hypothetical protein GQ600_1474 [Phytophthora cactorum]
MQLAKKKTQAMMTKILYPGGEFRGDIKIGAKPRVGYAVSLMRRSVYNYHAFTRYFKSAPASEQNVGTSITLEDCAQTTEMEGLTDQLAQFCLGEVQKEGIATKRCL